MHLQNTQTNLFKNNLQDFPCGSGAAEGVSILGYKLGKSAAVVNTPQIIASQSFPLPLSSPAVQTSVIRIANIKQTSS